MPKQCILIANEPRSYREAIAWTIRNIRPLTTVITVVPEELEHAIRVHAPKMVVCDTPPSVSRATAQWILLYPKGAPHVVIHVGGQHVEATTIDFATLMIYVDMAIRTQMGEPAV